MTRGLLNPEETSGLAVMRQLVAKLVDDLPGNGRASVSVFPAPRSVLRTT